MRINLFHTFYTVGLLWSSLSFGLTCDLKGAIPDLTQIARSCEALMDTMDATEVKKEAFTICCDSTKEYLKKNPLPCSDKGKVKYRIELGLAVCDKIKDPTLDYEHDYCVNQMLYHISDIKVLDIADSCSPSGGRPAASRRGQKAEAPTGDGAVRHHHGGGGAASADGADDSPKPVDLHMDDEAYSKCQRIKLGRYIEKLDQEIKAGPADQTFCAKPKT